MKDFPGTPGTFLGLVLRVSQFVFAVGSIGSMATTNSFFIVTAYRVAGIRYRTIFAVMMKKGVIKRWLTLVKLQQSVTYSQSYLIASMGLLVIWSFVLALFDAYALVKKKVLHNAVLVSLFVVGDWVTAILSLAAASASAGVTVLYFNDIRQCHFGEECQKYQISVALGFLSWISVSISSLIMLWLLAAG